MPKDPSRAAERGEARDTSLHPIPFEEAVADLLKVKKPESKTKSKKTRSRERQKRNI
jgi:hypothetical protein